MTNKLSDLIAILKFKSIYGKLELSESETSHILSILEKVRNHLTELELKVEKLEGEK